MLAHCSFFGEESPRVCAPWGTDPNAADTRDGFFVRATASARPARPKSGMKSIPEGARPVLRRERKRANSLPVGPIVVPAGFEPLTEKKTITEGLRPTAPSVTLASEVWGNLHDPRPKSF